MPVIELVDGEARVARGAKFLDGVTGGPEWVAKIKRPLKMVDCHECVLGQAFGTYYYRALDRFNLKEDFSKLIPLDDGGFAVPMEVDSPAFYGFCVFLDESLIGQGGEDAWDDARKNWARLADLWDTEINARKAAIKDKDEANGSL